MRRALAGIAAVLVVGTLAPAARAQIPGPHVVLALIDSGINPYHAAFRDDSPLAYQHPSTYIPGYPSDAPALNIALDAATYEEAVARDAALWQSVQSRKVYWIPGTRIVGAVHWNPGGTVCPGGPEMPPLNLVNTGTCPDRKILDEVGHGTMTASRAASALGSLVPSARIVAIEGLTHQAVRWAADQGWIDVQSNSWLSLAPPPVTALTVGAAFAEASQKHVVLAASGNGAGYVLGFAPTPTYVLSTAAPGVILVGAHDNGNAALWSGSPPTVVADGYAGPSARNDHMSEFGPHPRSCCTSAAAPYAAGGAAAVILEARRILGDTATGVRNGVVARGSPTERGPLADGELSLQDFRDVFFRTAHARPVEGLHDGLAHWLAGGREPEYTQYGPGANPYCQGCITPPAQWSAIPQDTPAFPLVGYGAINELSLADAREVLLGKSPVPDRPVDDAMFATDQQLRKAIFLRP